MSEYGGDLNWVHHTHDTGRYRGCLPSTTVVLFSSLRERKKRSSNGHYRRGGPVAAFLFTGPFEFVAYRNRRPDARETEQLTTRVRYVNFNNQAPQPQKHKL